MSYRDLSQFNQKRPSLLRRTPMVTIAHHVAKRVALQLEIDEGDVQVFDVYPDEDANCLCVELNIADEGLSIWQVREQSQTGEGLNLTQVYQNRQL